MTFIEQSGVTTVAGAAEVVEFQATLPVLIERASRTLLDAKSSGEVLEARDMARMAYDAARSAGRIAKAQKAHDEIISAIHRAQGEASYVRARAEMRLADEIDAAQERGELASAGGDRSKIPDRNFAPSMTEVALRNNVCTGCGWEKPARSNITEEEGTLVEFAPQKLLMQPRDGLRADCLRDPRAIWVAALFYTMERTKKGEAHARSWAYGIFRGVYPGGKLPVGWYDMRRCMPQPDALGLIEREVKRFRKTKRAA